MPINITGMDDLQNRIQKLKQLEKEQVASLKDSYEKLVISITPVNIIRAAMENVVETPGLKSTVFDTIVSAGAGLLSKKVVSGKSAGVLRKVAGLATQFIVANFVRNKMPDLKDQVNGNGKMN